MNHILEISLKRPLMTSNGQRRAHWTTVRKAKADTELLVTAAARKANLPRFARCQVTVIWWAPDARVRDSDSLAPFLKASLDALVRGGWLPNGDGFKSVLSTKQVVAVDRERPRITIELEAADA